jgi:hypothetical protein
MPRRNTYGSLRDAASLIWNRNGEAAWKAFADEEEILLGLETLRDDEQAANPALGLDAPSPNPGTHFGPAVFSVQRSACFRRWTAAGRNDASIGGGESRQWAGGNPVSRGRIRGLMRQGFLYNQTDRNALILSVIFFSQVGVMSWGSGETWY